MFLYQYHKPFAVGAGALFLFAIWTGAETSQEGPAPSSAAPAPLGLVASPSDPFMVEAIRLARLPRAEDGPWGGAQRSAGPKITIQMPGGPITLTHEQLADANAFYPQIKARPYSLNGSY